MKKKILVFTAAFLVTISTTFANNTTPIPQLIVKQLNQEFQNINNVEWKVTPDYYKASFTVAGNSLEAFFSYNGNLIAQSRKINIDQLPMSLIKEAKQKGFTNEMTELFELLTERGTEYFITFNTGKETKTYQSNGNGWNYYQSN